MEKRGLPSHFEKGPHEDAKIPTRDGTALSKRDRLFANSRETRAAASLTRSTSKAARSSGTTLAPRASYIPANDDTASSHAGAPKRVASRRHRHQIPPVRGIASVSIVHSRHEALRDRLLRRPPCSPLHE
ncbi:hypothetical protein NDU88_005224 [Pleurodeles waltl]|uniref:Uncharacterized protein n=1 Tax=Pleurodeles waltl TaxID=8319 RepID=A0AAV7L045_PLEWA|nr:hypothetical protein NDU88_005224 [Pleurodeles waltl]